MTAWPRQQDCNRFYGNPRGAGGGASAKWVSENLTTIRPPYRMTYAGKPVATIRVHKKCAASLTRVLQAIWAAAGQNQATVDRWGASIYGGAYNFRLMRGGNALSMHSWGCAIDLDPARNGLVDQTPHFASVPEVLAAFADEGWEWGGDWSRRDGMHWQAAWTKDRPARVAAPVHRFADIPADDGEPEDGRDDSLSPEVYAPAELTPAEIRANKLLLRAKGYSMVGEPDGDMGPRTVAAIAAFQKVNGLPITATFDEATRKSLANGGKAMVVADARANATPAEVAAKVPEVAAARRTGLLAKLQNYWIGAVAAVWGVKDYLAQVWTELVPLRQALDSIPWQVFAVIAVIFALGLWWSNADTAEKSTEAYRQGDRT